MAKEIIIPDNNWKGPDNTQPFDKTAIWHFQSTTSSEKTKVVLHKNLFTFLLEGVKVVHHSGQTIRINPTHFMLLSSNNILMSEKLSTDGRYSSLVLLFDDSVFTELFHKYPGLLHVEQEEQSTERLTEFPVTNPDEAAILTFEKDPFLYNYAESLRLMLEDGKGIPPALQRLKIEELLLYIAQREPERLRAFHPARSRNTSDIQLQQTVENNVHTNISVEELAFLCHNSLSTFKRRFARIYGTSPNKWILQKRMQLAATLLQKGHEKPSDVYHKVGYENHSSFTQSFKQIYGVTPKEYGVTSRG